MNDEEHSNNEFYHSGEEEQAKIKLLVQYSSFFIFTSVKSHIINNLLTSSIRSLQGNLRPRPWYTSRPQSKISL